MSDTAVMDLPVSSSTLVALVAFDSAYYGVSPDLMRGIIKRESNFNQYAEYKTSKEDSVGISQINLKAHPEISRAQAQSPVWAINYLAQQLSNGHGSMWSTYTLALHDP